MLLGITACPYAQQTGMAGTGAGITMAYEVSGRVTSDESSCDAASSDVSVAMFDSSGALLDETRTDAQGKFNVSVRNADAAEGMLAQLDADDPTVQVTLRVQDAGGNEQRFSLRLPRPIHGREYRVRLHKKDTCKEGS